MCKLLFPHPAQGIVLRIPLHKIHLICERLQNQLNTVILKMHHEYTYLGGSSLRIFDS